MDINLPKWIQLSINKNFDSNKGNYKLWFQYDGIQKLEELQKSQNNWAEIRTNGPTPKDILENESEYEVMISAICASKTNDDLSDLNMVVGTIIQAFGKVIPILKLGNLGSDDKSFLACLELRSDTDKPIDVINWGLMNPTDGISYTAIEGFYKLRL